MAILKSPVCTSTTLMGLMMMTSTTETWPCLRFETQRQHDHFHYNHALNGLQTLVCIRGMKTFLSQHFPAKMFIPVFLVLLCGAWMKTNPPSSDCLFANVYAKQEPEINQHLAGGCR